MGEEFEVKKLLTRETIIIPDRAEAIAYAIEKARRGDIILLAGKGHEEYEIDGRGKHPFRETDIVREAALRRYCAAPKDQ